MSSAAPLLDVRGISRSFGKVDAVKDLSFEVAKGQICGFIGPNGAGKTTTMRILATLDLPDAGDVHVAGHSVLVEPRKACMHLGFMADRFVPYANLRVDEFLDFMARAYGLRGQHRRRTLASVSAFCGLDAIASRPTTGLSKGMGQRLHLAKTLLHDPQLLILDEPAAGLDPRARVEFRDLLKELASAGKAILISSHLLSELAETCEHVVVVERGRVAVTGSIRDIAKGIQARNAILVSVREGLDEAERFLLTQPMVSDVRPIEGRLGFEFEGDEDQLADLLARMVGDGLRVSEFKHVEASLEEIFLRTTEGELQ